MVKRIEYLKEGDYVQYTGAAKEKQNGIVKRIDNQDQYHAYVVYNCGQDWKNFKNYTGEKTKIQDLEKGWCSLPKKNTKEIKDILNERGLRYGEFVHHAAISQEMKKLFVSCDSWEQLSSDKKEALEMIAHKIARILNGDPGYADSWHDIAGYATLIADRLDG